MKILVDISGNIKFYYLKSQKRNKFIIDSYVENKFFEEFKLLELDEELANKLIKTESNSSIMKLLAANGFRAWIKISEESQFLALFNQKAAYVKYIHPKKPYDTKQEL